jgi:2-polyprenyl-3-methyl-5-hydroxy-6-metoxy-1,4-benzoquinol methylase
MLSRQSERELMDDPALSPQKHAHALEGLARLNMISGSAKTLWHPVRQLADSSNTRTLKVLDVATGGADVPISLWRFARQEGYDLSVDGCDISPTSIELACHRVRTTGAPSRFFKLNLLTDELPCGYDVIVSSLFMHHLSEDQVVAALRKMAGAAKRMVIVSDLVREYANLYMVTVASRLLSRSPVVHFDGPASVRAAFTMVELCEMAEQAGLAGATVEARFPCRMLLKWRKDNG